MTILQSGQAIPNLPGLYVNEVPPQANFLSPASTDILGIVGVASWGPVNAPTTVAGLPDFITKFGNPGVLKYDLGTQVWAASLQGSQNMRGVRVTDGTDVAASAFIGIVTATSAVVAGGTGYTTSSVVTLSNGAVIAVSAVTSGAITAFTVTTQPTSEVTGAGAVTAVSATGGGTGATFTFTYAQGLTATSKYTGSGANGDTVAISAGRQTGTWQVVVNHNGLPTENYQNIGLGLTGNALWIAIAAAVNNGVGRAPSQIVVLTAGTSTAAPVASTATLAGGTDGSSGVTGTTLVGTDATPRTGMYALRKQGCAVGVLAGCDASATWPSQVAFGLSEGVYMIGTGPSGDTISNAITTKSAAGIDSWAFKLMFGDWVYFLDTINGYTRLVPPQGFVAGWIAAYQPQFSSLNKQLQGIVGTQKTSTGVSYYDDDLALLYAAGIEVITNPVPGGPYFGARMGVNTSSNPAINGDNYARMTNFIAATINGGLGPFIGQLQLRSTQLAAKVQLDAYFQDLANQGAIGTPDPTVRPWLVTLDGTNNPQAQVGRGIMRVDVLVIYASVIAKLIVNVQGGQTVTINQQSVTSAV